MQNRFIFCYGFYFTGVEEKITGTEQMKVCICSMNPDTLEIKYIIDAHTGERVKSERFWRKVSGRPKPYISFELPEKVEQDFVYSPEDLEDLKKL